MIISHDDAKTHIRRLPKIFGELPKLALPWYAQHTFFSPDPILIYLYIFTFSMLDGIDPIIKSITFTTEANDFIKGLSGQTFTIKTTNKKFSIPIPVILKSSYPKR